MRDSKRMTTLSIVTAGIKERLLIATNDTTYDSSLNAAGNEAIFYINMRLSFYGNDTVGNNASILTEITSDIGAGIFKRRQMPQDMDTGWYAQGLKKLSEYIDTTYKKGTFVFIG
jgi:hypothetical protein